METDKRSFVMKELLGAGGFGEVYRATMIGVGGLQTEVAVKMLRDAASDSVSRMRDEARLLSGLSHPAILKVMDLTSLDGRVSLVAEFVDGVDLSGLGGARLPVRALLEVVGATAEALHVAWSSQGRDGECLNLVHRDVKPSNIRLGRHGEVKLLDFGIAWSAGQTREAKTRANAMVGSVAYMAPERFSDDPVGHPSDVYSLGCVLFEGLAGEALSASATAVQVARLAAEPERHRAWVEERLERVPREVPEPVLVLLREMLAWDPSVRPTAKQVADRCEELADGVEGQRLKVWSRTWNWDRGTVDPGPLSGTTLDELSSSMERPFLTPGAMNIRELPLGVAPELPVSDLAETPDLHAAGPRSATPVALSRRVGMPAISYSAHPSVTETMEVPKIVSRPASAIPMATPEPPPRQPAVPVSTATPAPAPQAAPQAAPVVQPPASTGIPVPVVFGALVLILAVIVALRFFGG